jgi:penicillin-binding protein 1A
VRGGAPGRAVELAQVPRHLVDAVLAMEDRRFFAHAGMDLRGVIRAAFANLDAGGTVQGGSTITQQLAKNLFLTSERTWARKLQEMMLALWLERRLSKEDILARYLNTVYLGAGAYGVEAASQRYFGTSVEQLTLAQSAMLAGLIQAPSRFAPTRSLDEAHRRARIVLDAMMDAGSIDAATAEEAKAHPAELAVLPVEQAAYGYAADFAAAAAHAMLGEVGGNFAVATTIDRRLQLLAERTVDDWLAREGGALAVQQAALVAMAPDGAVLAMAGGRDYAQSQFNRAVQARRQPGSLFKLFVYLAALRAGMSPDSPVEDAPLQIADWQPQDYADRYLGLTDLRTAFAQSLNTAAVRLQEQVGREQVIALAQEMGIASPLPPHRSLALGSAEATLLELTAAYAAVLADVRRVEPYVVRAARAPGGATFRRRPTASPRPDWPRPAIMELLLEAVRSGTGSAAALDVPVFGKTATTQDHRDAWFIGFTEGPRGWRVGRQRRPYAHERRHRRWPAGADLAQFHGGGAEALRRGGRCRRRARRPRCRNARRGGDRRACVHRQRDPAHRRPHRAARRRDGHRRRVRPRCGELHRRSRDRLSPDHGCALPLPGRWL